MAATGGREYAGFWLRFVAYLIDSLVMGAVVGIVIGIAVGFLGIEYFRALAQGMALGVNEPNPVFPAMLLVSIMTLVVFSVIASWLYFAGMESSGNQGTLGKMALGLVVTDMNGQPISFARASGRFFAKIITGMVPLGDRLHHGRIHGEKAGAARYDRQLSGVAEGVRTLRNFPRERPN